MIMILLLIFLYYGVPVIVSGIGEAEDSSCLLCIYNSRMTNC